MQAKTSPTLWLSFLLPIIFFQRAGADTFLTVGNYAIDDSCLYTTGGPTSAGEQLSNVLTSIRFSITNKILPNVALGTQSHNGFSAFFKTNNNKGAVQALFQRILDGNFGPAGTQPTFKCISPYAHPDEYHGGGCFHQGLIAYVDPINFPNAVVVCPSFFYQASIPLSTMCPSVKDNVMGPSGTHPLAGNQFSIIVHELGHLLLKGYVAETLRSSQETEPAEVYEVQECATLDASAQVINVQNYAFYGAGEFSSTLFWLDVLLLGALGSE